MSITVPPEHMTDLLSAAVKDPRGYFGKYGDVSPGIWNPQWKGWIFTGNQCLAVSLARLEARIAIPEFVRRFPNYRVTTGGVEWRPLRMTRRLKALPATVL